MRKLVKKNAHDADDGKVGVPASDLKNFLQSTNPSSIDEVLESHRLINSAQLLRILPASQMSIWRWERQGILPKHLNIGGRNYWHLRQILEFIEIRSNPDAGEIGGGNDVR